MLRRIGKTAASIVALPFMLLLLPAVALGIFIIFVVAIPSGIRQTMRWKRDLRENGRITTEKHMLSDVNGGTLIVDRPGFKWDTTHCWWTPDMVVDCAPVEIPTDDDRMNLCNETKQTTAHPFDDWCWKRYISPQSGTAILVTSKRGEAVAANLQAHLNNVDMVYAWSAPASLTLLHTQDER